MYRKVKPVQESFTVVKQFPHCDQRILHAPHECRYCDEHREWQELRSAWGIAFTGFEPEGTELPCPADYARGDTHKNWYGNIAKPPLGEVKILHNHLGGGFRAGCPGCENKDV